MEIMSQPHYLHYFFKWPRLIRVQPRDLVPQTIPLVGVARIGSHDLRAAVLNMGVRRVHGAQQRKMCKAVLSLSR